MTKIFLALNNVSAVIAFKFMLFRIKIFFKLIAGLKKISEKLRDVEKLLTKSEKSSKLAAKEVEISVEVHFAPFHFCRILSEFRKNLCGL